VLNEKGESPAVMSECVDKRQQERTGSKAGWGVLRTLRISTREVGLEMVMRDRQYQGAGAALRRPSVL
jgi:hypothetical protein